MLEAPQLDQLAAPRGSAFPFRQTRRRIRTIILSTALIATFCGITAPRTSAQELGEIARQERVKKENNPAPPATHVYTNEDMHRQQILTPEDQSRFSATTQPATVAPPQSAIQLASELTPSPTPPPTAQPVHLPGNADLLIGASPKYLTVSTTPNKISLSTQAPIQHSAQQTNQAQARTNISSASTTRAKINSAPVTLTPTRANISVASATDTSVPQNETPLGDVARYYRGIKHQSARANAQLDPGPANAPSAPASATTIPNAIPLNQMPLGDVARYYRAKAREESQAQAQEVAAIQTKPPTTPVRAITPVSKYPLTLSTMPLASPKRTPTLARRPTPSRIALNANHALAPKRSASGPIAPSTTSRRLVAPKPSVGGSAGRNATTIRIASGDTLWQLARKYLGSATRWTELQSLNPAIQNPKRLQVGTQLSLFRAAY